LPGPIPFILSSLPVSDPEETTPSGIEAARPQRPEDSARRYTILIVD